MTSRRDQAIALYAAGSVTTLQQAADILGVTRECVRQYMLGTPYEGLSKKRAAKRAIADAAYRATAEQRKQNRATVTLWSKIEFPEADPLDGCWLWMGLMACTDKQRKYPHPHAHSKALSQLLGLSRPDQSPRALLYRLIVGPIPKTNGRCHHAHATCGNPRCVNPYHARLRSTAEWGREKKARKGQRPEGMGNYEWVKADPERYARLRAGDKARSKRYYERKKAAAKAQQAEIDS